MTGIHSLNPIIMWKAYLGICNIIRRPWMLLYRHQNAPQKCLEATFSFQKQTENSSRSFCKPFRGPERLRRGLWDLLMSTPKGKEFQLLYTYTVHQQGIVICALVRTLLSDTYKKFFDFFDTCKMTQTWEKPFKENIFNYSNTSHTHPLQKSR